MRPYRFRHLNALLALAAACSSETSDPNPAPAGGVASITVTPANPVMEQGSTRALVGVARDAAGQPVSVKLTWATSNGAIATVDTSGVVTAIAAGGVGITASYLAIHSPTVGVTVTATAPWPTTGASSGELIDAAVASGVLTAEQGLIYQVFASFADRRLPPEYRGRVESTLDNPILARVSAGFSSLSPATQATLAPFFLTPGDPDGWYAARVPLSIGGSFSPAAARFAAAAEDCTILNSLFTRRTTTHFAVHYVYNDVYGAAVADMIMPELERIWTTETEAFGRIPLSDATVVGKGNGCDGQLDIWILPAVGLLGGGRPDDPLLEALGWTSTYNTGCAPSPAYIGVWATPWPELKKLRGLLAHEFWHVLELGSYPHSGACSSEYFWLGEATGNWAIDLVYPTDQFEHEWAAGYSFFERLVPIDEPGQGTNERANGYSEYVFLLYLARTYGNSAVKDIWDATGGARSVEAVVAAVESRGGIDAVWPEFALALWNNYRDQDQDVLHSQDDLIWGMREAFDRGDAGNANTRPSVEVDLQGGPRENYPLLETAGAGLGLPRLSIHADYLKFTDADVAPVLYLNAMALATVPHLKIQALVKIGGSWKAEEDWTAVLARAYCRDLAAERIQELVLIYTNSTGTRPSGPIQLFAPPNVGASNVGCNKWVGTSSIVLTAADGGSSTAATALTFERERPAGAPLPDGSGQEAFTLVSGAVIGSGTSPCFTSNASGPALADDGRLLINLDNQFFGLAGAEPPNREILQGIGSTILSTSTTICTGGGAVGDQVWTWLEIPVLGANVVSADGRTMSGDTTIAGPVASQTLKWNLTAVREP